MRIAEQYCQWTAWHGSRKIVSRSVHTRRQFAATCLGENRFVCSLRGRRLKVKRRGVLRARSAPLALSHLKLPFPSLSNACHAGYKVFYWRIFVKIFVSATEFCHSNMHVAKSQIRLNLCDLLRRQNFVVETKLFAKIIQFSRRDLSLPCVSN